MAETGQISIDQLGIASVLAMHMLRVPPNQREYAWKQKQVLELFQDLSQAISSGEPSYFLGALVTVPKGTDVLEVVDGQQRLATTALLLDAIRIHLSEIGENVRAEDIQRMLTGIDVDANEYVPRLRLNADDNVFFQSAILGTMEMQPRLPSHHLLLNARQLARKHVKAILAGHGPANHATVLIDWVKYLRHSATVVLLKAPSTANAYKMFQTLNDRGLRTSQADIIKNHLFGQSGTRLNEAQAKWTQMRAVLETIEEEDITLTFLRQALISVYGYVRREDLYDKVVSRVHGESPAIALLSTLEIAAYDYVAITNSTSEKWNGYPYSTRQAIDTINLLTIRPMRPLMLAVARKFDLAEADRAFQTMVSWGVRLLVAGETRVGTVEQSMAARAKDITDRKISTAKGLAKAVGAIIPNDLQFRQDFSTATVSKAALGRYYLRSLERAHKNEAEPWYLLTSDPSVITLEHVLPLAPGQNWPDYDSEAIRAYSKRIGNQVLLQASTNHDLRSASFIEKREIYRESPYETTRHVAELTQWLPENIVNRQEQLAELAVKAWPV